MCHLYRERWLRPPTSHSPATHADVCLHAQVNRGAEPVEFADLYGLWIILAAGLGTGALVMFAQVMQRDQMGGGAGAQQCRRAAVLLGDGHAKAVLRALAASIGAGTAGAPTTRALTPFISPSSLPRTAFHASAPQAPRHGTRDCPLAASVTARLRPATPQPHDW